MNSRSTPRPLILLTPGSQTRHYLRGILRAARRLGLEPRSLELLPIREQLKRAPIRSLATRQLIERVGALVADSGVTDVISCAATGGVDLGVFQTDDGPGTIWSGLGLHEHILWTDHPNWACDGRALEPIPRATLARPCIRHILKSPQAADEARAVLGWPNVAHMPMAEDYEILTPARDIAARHDVVAIVGAVSPVPEALQAALDLDDPDPAELDRAMTPYVLAKWDRLAETAPSRTASLAFARDLLEARAARPSITIREHALALERDHAETVAWLNSDPKRWFRAQAILRQAAGWRRSFWLAWLARRVDLGVYGCDASTLGIAQPDDARRWVAYDDQPSVYALGRCAININQSHDEAGVTHKPFQIAASGVPLLHHTTAGLFDLFEPKTEVRAFSRGPELLHIIDELCAHETTRMEMAERALTRARAEHSWTRRVETMLGLEIAEQRAAA